VAKPKNQNAVFIRRSLNELTLGEMSPRQPSVVNEKSNEITGASLRGTAGDNNTFKGCNRSFPPSEKTRTRS
jgi:hypothetical protein